MNASLISRLAILAGAVGGLALCGHAFAGDRSRHGHNDCGRPAVRVGFGISSYGSGVSVGFGTGFRSSDCGSRYTYRSPRYGAPVVVSRPCYTSYSQYLYTYPRTVVVSQPVVTQPVVIQQPVYVQAPPVQQVVQQPVTILPPGDSESTSASTSQPSREPQQGRYQDRELGDAYLRMNDAENAVRVYKRYLSAWNGDGTVTRNLGFAQIDRGDVQDGFRSVVQGYKLEKDLIKRPIRMEDLGGKIGFERLLDAAARGAAGTNTAEGWLTVALLEHTAGHRQSAATSLQKAKEAGLDEDTMDLFAAELGKPAK